MTREELLGSSDVRIKKITSEALKKEIHIKELSIIEADEIAHLPELFMDEKGVKKGNVANKAFSEYSLAYVGFSLCDEKGLGFFSSVDEIKETLGKKYKAVTIGRVYLEIINAWSEEKKD